MSGSLPHHAENPEQKRIGIFISVLAVVMAIVSALAHQQANQMIVKEVKASNGFAWYQAKRQRSYANELELKRIEFELAGTPTDAQRKIIEAQKAKLAAKNAEYETENKDILLIADADRDAAAIASHKHHWFEFSEICLHIAVVLCSLVLLTEIKVFFQLGVGVTVIGLCLATYAHLGSHSHSAEHDVQPAANAQHAAPSAH
jgi:hypothetical protein